MANEVQELKNMLEDIKKQLAEKATTAQINKLIEEIKAKDQKIKSLEEKVDELEAKVSIQEKTITLLERKTDNGEQYTRRLNLRINGIPSEKNENDKACLTKVINEVKKLNIDVDVSSFDRAHRLGPVKEDEHGNPLPRTMIVRLTSFRERNI